MPSEFLCRLIDTAVKIGTVIIYIHVKLIFQFSVCSLSYSLLIVHRNVVQTSFATSKNKMQVTMPEKKLDITDLEKAQVVFPAECLYQCEMDMKRHIGKSAVW